MMSTLENLKSVDVYPTHLELFSRACFSIECYTILTQTTDVTVSGIFAEQGPTFDQSEPMLTHALLFYDVKSSPKCTSFPYAGL